ncbi:MAG: aldose epimerase family protein [Hoylesella marshii]|uniref:Aldose 1-epimerase n=2 Tax=Hoylesella marshii TaxID=189722 RepID=E0NPK5_9BACT|nr:aldose epimerase family protein [Hoylesella marshii]EFM02964.1 aldose 1-epimerase [Hoylesella marshii DSM 16973 = JCM 13450]
MSTMETENICGLKRKDFQTTINGKDTDLFILRNERGNEVAITNYGGAIVAIMVPDKNGKRANIVQGHDNIQDVINSPEPYLSTLIGRYGNRINKGRFKLHGKEYQLATNNGPNALHGGPKGFHTRVWDAQKMNDKSLVLNYISAYGEEGYSGELKVTVVYTFNDDNELVIDYMATTNKKTIINLTNHAFFSLAGIANPTPSIDNLICEINADFYLPIDETSIPTGEIRFVKGTPFDFRAPKSVGQDIDAADEQIKNGSGYDHCFVLNKEEEGELSFAARITEPVSGRTMEVYTTEPGVQLYTDNHADGYKGQNGATFPRRSAICFEAQHFPDSPNRPYFPSVLLCPEGKYKQTTIYKFGVSE